MLTYHNAQKRSPRELMITDGNRATGYSVTSLNSEWQIDEEMVAIDRAIGRGESAMDVFGRNGYAVRKNILDVYVISLSQWLRQRFDTVQSFAKARNAEYIVRKGDTIYCYGIITQIYSPEVSSTAIGQGEKEAINFSFQTLQASGFSRKEIWKLMDENPAEWMAGLRFEHL